MRFQDHEPSPSRRWWLFAFVWWTLNGIASASQYVQMAGPGGEQVTWRHALVTSLASAWLWVPLTMLALWLAHRYPLGRGRLLPRLGLHLLSVLAVVVFRALAVLVFNSWVGWYATLPPLPELLLTSAQNNVFLYSLVIGVAHAAHYASESRRRDDQLAEARLLTLKAQIQPHFLFNTLNTVGDEFFPISRQATIVYSRRIGGEWTAPRVASFSGVYPDIDPFISPDGSRLFFSSIRPVNGRERTDADIWVVVREGSGWGEPKHFGSAVNSRSDELYPSIDKDGVLYFGSDRPGGFGGWDIYRSRRVNGERRPARNLGAGINSGEWEFNPYITPDGRTLIFTGLNLPGGFGLGDLYASVRRKGEWQPRRNLGARVNSELDEYHPSLSPDRKVLYFVRHSYEPWVPGDIYYIPVRALGPGLLSEAERE